MASSSAITTRVGNAGSPENCLVCGVCGWWLRRLGDEPIKEVVLCDLEAGDLLDDFGPMAKHRIGVTLCLTVLL